ncbi:hypothetical protein C7M84_002542 [Penaeus vannamei]|uniref:Secreted protein n=1 Tax=Penaeus vannamei TaxID=6689 RepID=A0A3R7PVY3_PENVA|nr:hypothetical protein C7M84_002542 [Penaeus vannamei]
MTATTVFLFAALSAVAWVTMQEILNANHPPFLLRLTNATKSLRHQIIYVFPNCRSQASLLHEILCPKHERDNSVPFCSPFRRGLGDHAGNKLDSSNRGPCRRTSSS